MLRLWTGKVARECGDYGADGLWGRGVPSACPEAPTATHARTTVERKNIPTEAAPNRVAKVRAAAATSAERCVRACEHKGQCEQGGHSKDQEHRCALGGEERLLTPRTGRDGGGCRRARSGRDDRSEGKDHAGCCRRGECQGSPQLSIHIVLKRSPRAAFRGHSQDEAAPIGPLESIQERR